MKVLLANYSDSGGGAAKAAVRLCEALGDLGIDARLGVVDRQSSSKSVFELPRDPRIAGRVERRLARDREERLLRRHVSTNVIQHSLNLYSKVDVGWMNSADVDLVNLHWVNNDMISIRDVARIAKPIVWTLHDSWLFCGAEHHPNVFEDDRRFEEGYRGPRPAWTSGPDICAATYRNKARYWKGTRIHAVCPSSWEATMLERSALFRELGTWSCSTIPNAIDGREFYPMDRGAAKRALGIDPSRTVIGFGAAYGLGAAANPKGGHLLAPALRLLRDRVAGSDPLLLVYGPAEGAFIDSLGLPAISLGKIGGERLMNLFYNSCDVFACPSMVENLPYSCLEASACGVPVAAFRIGGVPDIVTHEETGYLAEPFDVEGLARGLEYCLAHGDRLGPAGAAKARGAFAPEAVAQAYARVFEAALRDGGVRP
jgi:glycosyltransferase involved in cell wall biosynthesis